MAQSRGENLLADERESGLMVLSSKWWRLVNKVLVCKTLGLAPKPIVPCSPHDKKKSKAWCHFQEYVKRFISIIKLKFRY